MIELDPKIVQSGLSRTVKKDGVTVEVSIIRLEHETEWSLEVVNSASTSIVWDDLFASDDEAFAEFERTVAEEGIRTFLDKEYVIPFRRLHRAGGRGALVFAKACDLGLEGIVTKRAGSRYSNGNSRQWLKSKNPAFVRE